METWDYAHCLPYFKRMENCLAAAADDPWRGHDGPLVLERGPATNPLFTAFFAASQEAGYHLTEDVNGYRQEGFAPFDRNIHRGRRLSAARAYLHPVMGRRNLTVRTSTLVTRINLEGRRAVGVEIERHGGGTETVHAGEVILAGGSINSPQLLLLSGARPGRGSRGTWHPGRGRPAGRRRPPPGPPRGLHPVQEPPARLDAADGHPEMAPAVHRGAVAVLPQRTRCHQPLRGRRVRAEQRRRRVPQPHVPLPAARDPLRRQRRRTRARLPGPCRADVLRRAWLGHAQEHGPARASRPALQLPLDRTGSPRMGGGRPRRAPDPQPGRDVAVQRRRDVPRARGHQRRRDPRLGGA